MLVAITDRTYTGCHRLGEALSCIITISPNGRMTPHHPDAQRRREVTHTGRTVAQSEFGTRWPGDLSLDPALAAPALGARRAHRTVRPGCAKATLTFASQGAGAEEKCHNVCQMLVQRQTYPYCVNTRGVSASEVFLQPEAELTKDNSSGNSYTLSKMWWVFFFPLSLLKKCYAFNNFQSNYPPGAEHSGACL